MMINLLLNSYDFKNKVLLKVFIKVTFLKTFILVTKMEEISISILMMNQI